MKVRMFFLMCLLAVSSLSFAANANRSQVVKALTNEYAKYVKAYSAKNLEPISNQIHPAWVGKIRGQTLNKTQLLSLTEDAMEATHSIRDMCIKIRSVSIKGNQVTAVVLEDATLNLIGPDGGVRQVSSSNLRRDVWIRSPQGWKLRRSEMLKTNV